MLKITFASFLLLSCTSALAAAPAPAPAPAQPQPPTIQSVGAISLEPSHDAKILADWYQKFGVDLQSAGGVYWGTFKNQSGPPYFAIHPKKADAPEKSSASIAVVFRVNDYSGYVSMLEKQGLKPESVEADSSGHFAHFRDPDGNEMTIWGD